MKVSKTKEIIEGTENALEDEGLGFTVHTASGVQFTLIERNGDLVVYMAPTPAAGRLAVLPNASNSITLKVAP